jgi:DNA-binding transcriptional LysR family regulator
MELSDLRLFIAATRHVSLHAAAADMHLTASALSKAIRRLETGLHVALFDRRGKTLVLNADGERLRQRALVLLQLAEQTQAEFEGASFRVRCRVAGPALLHWIHAPTLARQLAALQADSSVVVRTAFEDDALAQLLRGEADFALVTDEALQALPARVGLAAHPLGPLTMRLVAGATHPLAAKARGRVTRASAAAVARHDFACPPRSMLCGRVRGAGSDGWRDEQSPRRIRYWIDDLQVLLELVRSGQALAYLPEFALRQADLVRVDVTDLPFDCTESTWLAWRPTAAAGWQARLVGALS